VDNSAYSGVRLTSSPGLHNFLPHFLPVKTSHSTLNDSSWYTTRHYALCVKARSGAVSSIWWAVGTGGPKGGLQTKRTPLTWNSRDLVANDVRLGYFLVPEKISATAVPHRSCTPHGTRQLDPYPRLFRSLLTSQITSAYPVPAWPSVNLSCAEISPKYLASLIHPQPTFFLSFFDRHRLLCSPYQLIEDGQRGWLSPAVF
jgi:hypothetical protein